MRRKLVQQKWRQFGLLSLRTGLLWNLVAVLPAGYFLLLPKGSVVEPEDVFVWWIMPFCAGVALIGIPCYLASIVRRKARKLPYAAEMLALLFCLTPILLAPFVLHEVGVVRDLRAPWERDGGGAMTWAERGY